jgi:anaerobic selenocysteine-containing dehydrogenase
LLIGRRIRHEAARIVIVDPRRTVTVSACEVEAGKNKVLHLGINPGADLALFNALVTHVADQGWIDKVFIAQSTTGFNEMLKANRTSLEEAAKVKRPDPGPDQDGRRLDCRAKGQQAASDDVRLRKGPDLGQRQLPHERCVGKSGARHRQCRPGGGCVRMGGHQEGYSRPDYPGGRPAPYIDQQNDFVMGRWPLPFIEMHPADMTELRLSPGDLVELFNDIRSTQAMVYPTPTAKRKETFMLFANPMGVQGNVVSKGVNELVIPNYKQTRANIRKIASTPEVAKGLSFKPQEYRAS